jgi:hypothetical protein
MDKDWFSTLESFPLGIKSHQIEWNNEEKSVRSWRDIREEKPVCLGCKNEIIVDKPPYKGGEASED